MTMSFEMQTHLSSGVTTLCRAWALERADGIVMGFTDHDCDLIFDGVTFRADTGMSALALQQGTGLSIDNTEAIGALSDLAISEGDIQAGRFDGAQVRCWLVNWADTSQRVLQFRGYIGEIRRNGGSFEAELLGLTELLNRPAGRVYQSPCSAVLGDRSCGKDLGTAGYQVELEVQGQNGPEFTFEAFSGYEENWFQRGMFAVLGGNAAGLRGSIKRDETIADGRKITLWSSLGAELATGDLVRLTAGCDKQLITCKNKFDNIINYRGFPDIPGNDWLLAVPTSPGANGGSLR